MKKFLLLTLIFSSITTATLYAQGGPQAQGSGDPKAMLQQAKEKQKPLMIEKTGLSEAQADKVIEINFELRQSMMTDFRDLNEDQRKTRLAEFKAAREKRYSEIPLTAGQIQSVYAFYEEMGKNRAQRGN